MTRKRFVRLFLGLFTIGLAATLSILLTPPEATREGKTVHEWVSLLDPHVDYQAQHEQARWALVQIGAPAVPELERILRQRPNTWWETAKGWMTRWGLRKPDRLSLWELQYRASRAAYQLAESANVDIRKLIPHLVFHFTNSNYAASENARALAGAGTEGVAVLTNLLFTGCREVRDQAGWALHFVKKRPEAITALVRFANTETNRLLAANALMYLRGSQGPPDLLVPLGLKFLRSEDAYERWAGAQVLQGYTSHQGVEDALRRAAEDPDQRVRSAAAQSLEH